MEDDFWFPIFFNCNLDDILNLRLVCKESKNKLNDEYFWKRIMLKSFRDIHKLGNETWLSYYKRCNINYGIPVIIDEKVIHNENAAKSIYQDTYKLKCNILKNDAIQCFYDSDSSFIYVLNKQNQLRKFCKNDNSSLLYFDNVKNVELSNDLFIIDKDNNLFKSETKSILLDKDIINILKSYSSNTKIYYTKQDGTYAIQLNNRIVKVFDDPVLAWIKTSNVSYFINSKNNLYARVLGDDLKFKYRKFTIKAKALSRISKRFFVILGMRGDIFICDGKRNFEVGISHVKSLSEDCFLTENGDLYYFDKKWETVLIDTNVVSIGNFSRKKKYGCYVKKCI